MSDQDIIDTIKNTLAAGNPRGAWVWADEAELVLAGLRTAGYAVVKLPAPTGGTWDGEWDGLTGDVGWVVQIIDGRIWPTIQGHSFNPDTARAFAAALWAGAAKAEEGK